MAEQRTKRPRGPMGGPGRGMMPGEKPKDFKNSIGKLVRYLGRYWYAIVAVMIFAAVSTVFSVAGPKVMARAFYLYCQSVIVYTWPVYLFCSIQFYTGNDHDRNHAENLLPHA